jgi:hypothetical protein
VCASPVIPDVFTSLAARIDARARARTRVRRVLRERILLSVFPHVVAWLQVAVEGVREEVTDLYARANPSEDGDAKPPVSQARSKSEDSGVADTRRSGEIVILVVVVT